MDTTRLDQQLGHYARQLWDIQHVRIVTNNRIEAMKRDGLTGDDLGPMNDLLDAYEKLEGQMNRQLERLAKQHPLAEWIRAQPGVGLPGFARIMGCIGGLDRFPNVAKLWAYLGMHVTEGKAPKKTKGEHANWSQQGRVVCHQLADSIVKVGRGPYRQAYDDTKAKYLARPRIGESCCPMGYVHKDKNGKVLACVKTDAEGNETSAHIHTAAMRYAVKKFLAELWGEWDRIARAA